MKPPRLLWISACFVLTFVLGGVAAWILKPSEPPATVGVARIAISPKRALDTLDGRLKLTPEQRGKLLPIFVEWANDAGNAGRNQRRRLELFEQHTPRIREVLAEAQRVEFDRLVIDARKKFNSRIERSSRPDPE